MCRQDIFIFLQKTSSIRSGEESSGYRKELAKRNADIVEQYRGGMSIEELALRFSLSVYAIRKIIYQKCTETAACRSR